MMTAMREAVDWQRVVEPAVMWYWNAAPRPGDIARGLDAFADRGFGGFYVHPMPHTFRIADFHVGMTTPYLSDAYFDLIAETCDAAVQRGLAMWLYDEGGWPSGRGGGAVVAEDAAFGVWTMTPDGPRQHLGDNCDYPDLMNADATAAFIRCTHERYRAAIGHAFGNVVPGVFTDEPRLLGRVGTHEIPWSPHLAATYARLHDRDLDDDLPHCFNANPAGLPARRRYLAAVSTLVTEAYYKPLRHWCEQNDLLFEGHHSGEDAFARHGQYFGHFLQQARCYHVPGVDAIWRQVFPGRRANYVSLAASAAWLNRTPCALSESFNDYGAGLTLAQMRWIIAYQIVRGVNRIAWMPSLLRTDGPHRISTCQDFGPRDPRWLDTDLLTDFQRKAARFTLRGTPRPTVAVLYRSELVDEDDAAAFDAAHEALCDRIGDGLCAMAFVDADQLRRLRDVKLIVHHTDAPLDAAECAVQPADAIDDFSPYSLLRNATPVTGVRALPLTGGALMLHNHGDAPATFSFDWPTPLREVVLEDPLSRAIHPIARSGRRCTVGLEPGQLRAFERGVETAEPWEWLDQTPITGEWTVAETKRYTIEDDIEVRDVDETPQPTELGDYARPDFSGSLRYAIDLALQSVGDERVVIDLGEVFETAELLVNGRSVGRRAWSPYWFDVTPAVRSGMNRLEVRVTNTLAPQWLRDDVKRRDVARWSNMYLKTAHAFLPESRRAGLLGPVTLSRYAVVKDGGTTPCSER